MLYRNKALLAAFTAMLIGSCAHAQMNKGTWLVAGTMGFSHQAPEQNIPNLTPATNTFRLKPRLGYFIASNWATGIQLGYAHTSEKTEAPANAPNVGYSRVPINSKFTRKHNEYTAGSFVQRYWQLGGPLHLFIQGGGAFTVGTTKSRVHVTTMQPVTTAPPSGNYPVGYPFGLDGYGGTPAAGTAVIEAFSADESVSRTRELAFSLSPGIVYLATPRLGINLMLGEAALRFKSTSLLGPSRSGLKLDTYGLDMGMNTLQAGFQFHL
jgi:hypothetical protein